MPPRNRFTIYDVMEQNGVFERNPANSTARASDGTVLFQGPIQYPKMLYHPEGAEQIIVPAEVIMTPMGPKAVGEQRQLVHRVVNNAQEEADARAEGWHTHPSGSLRAAGKPAPATGAEQQIAELERQLKDLQEERARLIGIRGGEVPGPAATFTDQRTTTIPATLTTAAANPLSKPASDPGARI